ncbi:tripartite tricarboxylate transporter substrate binding protein [Variovorax dokdonensis]|uniref:Tripartite tricarboxylate transporter substrate binding protein n=1 Tax=Variovorax dokdonensis TaxID=344883 RepID=A0ABT7N922_9BURK|nr:tripartite tricarboxylate transporter substrate binding protein [Variovorax dokdonensis]MDM0044446.1 tripartite tricarboxylate transporter substrate binding protein [Variovorax dokdonensis]
MSNFTRRRAATLIAAAAFAGSAFPLNALADAYPSKPITVVVPYAPGGGVDIVTRIVTQELGTALGQTIIVDNKPGASTNIGMAAVAKAPADGYTLLTASPSLTSNGALFKNLSFDPASDFTLVGKIGYAPLVVVVPATSKFKTFKELVEYGKAHPDELSYGSAGNGSSGHLASELMKQETGVKAIHVPYKGGSPAITDLIGGRISFMSINPLEVIAHIQAGKLRALAVYGSKPTDTLPDLPTTASLGWPKLDATVWWGLIGPKGLPADVVARLNGELQKTLARKDVQDKLATRGAIVDTGSAAQFDAFNRAEIAKWTKVIKDAGIQAD